MGGLKDLLVMSGGPGGLILVFVGILWGIDYSRKNLLVKKNGVETAAKPTEGIPSQAVCKADCEARFERGEKRFEKLDEKIDSIKDNLQKIHIDIIDRVNKINGDAKPPVNLFSKTKHK